jgi:hypothetical protein
MSVNAGKGVAYHTMQVHYLTKKITFADDDKVVSLGWLPANSAVVMSGVSTRVIWNGDGEDAVNLGFRNSVQGATTDDNAFTETALDLDAVGHVAGDVVSAANLYFTAPVEVTASPTSAGTAPTAGEAYVYVGFIHFDLSEDL